MVRYTDEKGQVHSLEHCPIYDPLGPCYAVARKLQKELHEVGTETANRILQLAAKHFEDPTSNEEPPHLADANADALLQKFITEARSELEGRPQMCYR